MEIYIKSYLITLLIIFIRFSYWTIEDWVDKKIKTKDLTKELVSEFIASIVLSVVPILSALTMIGIMRKEDFPIFRR